MRATLPTMARDEPGMFRRPLLLAVATLTLALALACTGLALAHSRKRHVDIKVYSTTVTVPAGTQSTNVKALCKHRRLVGAGFYPVDAASTAILPSALQLGKRNVQARLQNVSSGEATSRIEAHCVKRLRTKVVRDVAVLPPNGLTTLKVACPGKRKALSGGFRTPPIDSSPTASRALTVSSYRAAGGRKWAVTALTYDDSGPAIVDGYVVCAKGVKVRRASERADVTTAATMTKVRCPHGTKVLSGGFKALVRGTPGLGAPLPIASHRRSKSTWLQTTARGAGSGAVGEKVWAYCAKRF